AVRAHRAEEEGLGPGEVESRWEPVAGALLEPGSDANSVVTRDASGRLLAQDVPTRVDAHGPMGTGSRRVRLQGVPITVAVGWAIGALLVGFVGGFALARALM
ncbi:MAG: hypothetical protein WCJ30_20460, partial [Deltaproteobacteria bacterium]